MTPASVHPIDPIHSLNVTPDVRQLATATTTAPALNRGLAVLAALCQEAPQSLDSLAIRLALPKASVFRFLATLQKIGIVRKTQDKRYEPLWALHPLADERTLMRAAVAQALAALCNATGCTTEWYEPALDGLRLEQQANPDTELCVKVRPGFTRMWSGEFEAVLRLGYAFAPQAPAPAPSLRVFVANGRVESVPEGATAAMLAECRRDRATADIFFNSNGVRRCAAAVFSRGSGAFLGVLALAEGFHFSRRTEQAEYIAMLGRAAASLP
ncbi:hypothetical protein DB346_21110 [Verrucomicrobia bacterium LW23]|nr:hypothetical protein DB346_21110 [Verrucomicrobia bacterium LW23]